LVEDQLESNAKGVAMGPVGIELTSFEEGIRRGTLSMEAAALRHVPLSRYLDDWRDLIRDQQDAGDLAPKHGSGLRERRPYPH
jgi:hypothetical protein